MSAPRISSRFLFFLFFQLILGKLQTDDLFMPIKNHSRFGPKDEDGAGEPLCRSGRRGNYAINAPQFRAVESAPIPVFYSSKMLELRQDYGP
jgi:hypothetical protein